MIRVTMDLDAFGLGVKIKTLATLRIVNDGTGTPARGNYRVEAVGKHGKVIRTSRVKNWPRKSKPALTLLRAALESLGY